MAQVRWTVGASNDLEKISENLGAVSESAASSFVANVLVAVASLEDHPRLGRMVPEYEMDRLRELIVRNYRVIYALTSDADTVHIFAVKHGSLNLRRQLGDSPWDRMV